MGIFFTIIILVSFTGQALGTSCSVSNRRTNLNQCLRDINGEGNNNTAYWFGTQYPTNCPQGSIGQTLECSNPLAGSNRTSLFSRIFPGGLNTNSLDRFLKMEFTSPPGTYTACGNTYKTNTTWSRDIDPLSPLTVRPWDVRFLPYLEWATLPGEMFTLVVYDPGYLVTHAIYNNIRGHDISTADSTIVYQGPGIMDDKILNPYVFMLFKQSGHVTVSSALKSQLHQNISFSELINQLQLTGPIGMNWLKVVGDIYAAQQHLNIINQCPKYVEEELNKLKKRPFLPSPLHNNVGITVRFNTAAIDFTVCCTKHSYSQESFELNPIGNPVYNSYKVSHTPSVAFLKAEFSSQASNFTGDMYTLMMIDPDVAASSIATEDRPLVHWLVANIRNGNVSSGDEYARYIGPRPPDRKPHYYYFLLYKQTATIPVSSLYAYSEHCSYAPGRLDGMLKSGALKWEDRPVWYDVYKAFPPKIEPKFERDLPNQHVKTIIYPEDLVRAKFYNTFIKPGVVDLQDHETPTTSQLFVEKYFEMKDNMKNQGASEQELFEAVTDSLRESGIRLVEKPKQRPAADQ